MKIPKIPGLTRALRHLERALSRGLYPEPPPPGHRNQVPRVQIIWIGGAGTVYPVAVREEPRRGQRGS